MLDFLLKIGQDLPNKWVGSSSASIWLPFIGAQMPEIRGNVFGSGDD